MGRFKGPRGILDCYMIPTAGVTSSGYNSLLGLNDSLDNLGKKVTKMAGRFEDQMGPG